MKYGFRRFECRDGLMRINGQRIVFRGVNRHEFSCVNGRAVTEEDMLYDIRFMKQNNINAVRTSHYPNQSLWYRLCDGYGIYLIDEVNLESHGSWQKLGQAEPSWNVPGNREEWKGAILDIAESMYERDKNHPSVLIWSLGNESYAGDVIASEAAYFHKADQRPVHYEGVFWNRNYDDITDIESRMYAKPEEIEQYLRESPKKPYISCEYMHAMGNSCGGMHLYTDLEDRYEMYQGGFIWDYIDQAIAAEEKGKTVLKYGGDFGDRATDYCFCTDGIVYADRRPSPKVQEVKWLYQTVKVNLEKNQAAVQNKNLFTNTNEYEFVLSVLQNGSCVLEKTYVFDVPPLEMGVFALGIPEELKKGACIYNLSVRLKKAEKWAEKGFEIGYAQAVFEVLEQSERKAGTEKESGSANAEEPDSFQVIHGDVNIGMRGRDFFVMFSRQEAGPISLVYSGKEYITRVPKPVFTRAYTDNDRGCGLDFDYAVWDKAGKTAKCTAFYLEEWEHHAKVVYQYVLPIDGICCTVSYDVHMDGRIDADYCVKGEKPFQVPLYGMEFKLPREFNRVRYCGNGPEENYCDRNQGARLGVYETTAGENMSSYLIPQECGNRTGIRWIEVMNENSCGIRFSAADRPLEGSVLPYSGEELEHALHLWELPEPSYTWVRILGEQMGVGGDGSWGAPVQERYQIPKRTEHAFSYRIEGIGVKKLV